MSPSIRSIQYQPGCVGFGNKVVRHLNTLGLLHLEVVTPAPGYQDADVTLFDLSRNLVANSIYIMDINAMEKLNTTKVALSQVYLL
jgi:hypothetical protein